MKHFKIFKHSDHEQINNNVNTYLAELHSFGVDPKDISINIMVGPYNEIFVLVTYISYN